MTTSAAMASAFFAEVAEPGDVFAIRDANGFPAPFNGDGKRAMPFWSLRSRAEKVIATVPDYQGFAVVAIPVDEWRKRWLPGLERDGLLVGLNWAGAAATGYDMDPGDVLARLPEAK